MSSVHYLRRYGTIQFLATAKSVPSCGFTLATQRAPTDAFYLADVTVENAVVGSAWLLGYTPAGGEFTILASGTAATSTFTISSVPSYAAVMLLELRVRKSSSGTKYKPMVQYANHNPLGVNMYISQIVDKVVT